MEIECFGKNMAGFMSKEFVDLDYPIVFEGETTWKGHYLYIQPKNLMGFVINKW